MVLERMLKKFLLNIFFPGLLLSALSIAFLEFYNHTWLYPAPALGTRASLFLNSFPTGAEITLNGKLLEEKTPARLYDLPPGEVSLELVLKGYLPVKKTLHLLANEENRIEVVLEKELPESKESFWVYVATSKLPVYPAPKEGQPLFWINYKEQLQVLEVTADGLWYKVSCSGKEGFIKTSASLSRKPLFAHPLYNEDISLSKILVFVYGYLPKEMNFLSKVADFKSLLEPLFKNVEDFHNSQFLGESTLSFETKSLIEGASYADLISGFKNSPAAHYVYVNSLFQDLLSKLEFATPQKETFYLELVIVPPFILNERKESVLEAYNELTKDFQGKHLILLSEDLLLESTPYQKENILYAAIARGFGVYAPFGNEEIKADLPLVKRKIPSEILKQLGISPEIIGQK